MGVDSQSNEYRRSRQGVISHYQLDFQCNGNKHYYIWRYNPFEAGEQHVLGMLIDLNNVYVPDWEIEKMVFGFVIPTSRIISIAFVNCHMHNQQNIKRRLKIDDVKLYSQTAFFSDTDKARKWLEIQCANC